MSHMRQLSNRVRFGNARRPHTGAEALAFFSSWGIRLRVERGPRVCSGRVARWGGHAVRRLAVLAHSAAGGARAPSLQRSARRSHAGGATRALHACLCSSR